MAGLLDIGKLKKSITIRDRELSIEGLTARGLFELLDQFPELRKVLSDAGIAANPALLMAHVPGAVTTIIAYVCGYRRSEMSSSPKDNAPKIDADFLAALASAGELTLGEQTEIIKTAWELTFPKGLQSFLAALEGVGAIGSGWAPAMASPGQSNNSSPADIPSK